LQPFSTRSCYQMSCLLPIRIDQPTSPVRLHVRISFSIQTQVYGLKTFAVYALRNFSSRVSSFRWRNAQRMASLSYSIKVTLAALQINLWFGSWIICQNMECPPLPIGHTHASLSPGVIQPPSNRLTPISLQCLDYPRLASYILPTKNESQTRYHHQLILDRVFTSGLPCAARMSSRQQNERKFGQWQKLPNGGRRYWFEVTGRQRWKARYIKEVDAREKTTRFWQEIFDSTGELVEVHEKYPVDMGHRKTK